MLKWIVGIIALLWIVGYIQIPFFNVSLFVLFGHPFTIHHLLLLLLLGYAVRFLPGMLQTAVIFLIILWLLSVFIFPVFMGFGSLLLLILVLILVFSFI